MNRPPEADQIEAELQQALPYLRRAQEEITALVRAGRYGRMGQDVIDQAVDDVEALIGGLEEYPWRPAPSLQPEDGPRESDQKEGE